MPQLRFRNVGLARMHMVSYAGGCTEAGGHRGLKIAVCMSQGQDVQVVRGSGKWRHGE